MLLEQLRASYDYIVIDTPPDLNVLTRNAIAQSDLVVVPVDPSAMSVHCLEQLIASTAHLKNVQWSIVRTMINRQATRLRKHADQRLGQNLNLSAPEAYTEDDEDEDFAIENPDEFIAMLERHEHSRFPGNGSFDHADNSPIFLLNSMTYRSEQQNRLSFLGKSCFDSRAYSRLAEQYLEIAREIEQVIGLSNEAGGVARHPWQHGHFLGSGLAYPSRKGLLTSPSCF